MRRFVMIAFLAPLLVFAGCSFKRSDFVCGADGKPDGELSTSAKVAGTVAAGPRVRVNY